jgi:hypothetical protein
MRQTMAMVAVVVAACGDGAPADSESSPDATVIEPDASTPTVVDSDHDGLDDAREQQLAEDYLPYLSLDPDDGCPLDGLVARVRPHPAYPTKILIVYSHLYQLDCGVGGHVGDNEAFGIVIDPAKPAPAGILAIKTASHQGTPCERDSECSTCGDGRTACDVTTDAGGSWPVLYASKDKHGQYAIGDRCSLLQTCFDVCTLNPKRARPPVVNVGEPGAPLVTDLTTAGFITAANGWTEAELQHFNPWDTSRDFGSAGNIAGDLTDEAFIPDACP